MSFPRGEKRGVEGALIKKTFFDLLWTLHFTCFLFVTLRAYLQSSTARVHEHTISDGDGRLNERLHEHPGAVA
ncbi:hypothetical protein ACO22_03787 [Paracoccidioides brasiliensis]|uniref:Uncharacterized protein n=1 Tax=Paracoccidioides brasiliensis TaxID=121759 RepID=A0A1D2JF44_PARBR|nr:hypothetical protein ACO22_03787 [Paracoccidioides brasiliensis]